PFEYAYPSRESDRRRSARHGRSLAEDAIGQTHREAQAIKSRARSLSKSNSLIHRCQRPFAPRLADAIPPGRCTLAPRRPEARTREVERRDRAPGGEDEPAWADHVEAHIKIQICLQHEQRWGVEDDRDTDGFAEDRQSSRDDTQSDQRQRRQL